MPILLSASRYRSQGFSLIEVLITVFVVAVGLLSVAGLQALSKKSSYDSVQRTMAATLAQDVIERMRANPTQLTAYQTNASAGVSEGSAPAVPGTSCSSNTGATVALCTPAQQATYDLYQWSRALFGDAEKIGSATGDNAGGLASARGCITAGTSAGTVNVAIAWRGVTAIEDPMTATDTAHQCGVGSGITDYDGPGDTAGSGKLRRQLIVTTFIN